MNEYYYAVSADTMTRLLAAASHIRHRTLDSLALADLADWIETLPSACTRITDEDLDLVTD